MSKLTSINRLKMKREQVQTALAPFPSLVKLMSSGVVTREIAAKYDSAVEQWWNEFGSTLNRTSLTLKLLEIEAAAAAAEPEPAAPAEDTEIEDGSVTLAKLADIASGTVIGRASSGAGVPEVLTTIPSPVQDNITRVGTVVAGVWNGTVVSMTYGGTSKALTAVEGGVVYTDATSMEVLDPGDSGQLLQSNGAAAPSWFTLPSYVLPTRQVLTDDSIQGGGDLSADLTLKLVNDDPAPGADHFYGTDAVGNKGWHVLPTGGSITNADTLDMQDGVYYLDLTNHTGVLPNASFPGLTGDVTATAGSIATTIANDAVTTVKIANLNVTTGKLADSSVTTAKLADDNVTIGKIAGSAAAGAGTYLDKDGNWTTPAGTGSGEANSGVNVGTGAGVFKDKSGVNLRFRSILGSGLVSASAGTDDVTVALGAIDNTKLVGNFSGGSAVPTTYTLSTAEFEYADSVLRLKRNGTTPGLGYYFGTDSSGVIGYYELPDSSTPTLTLGESLEYDGLELQLVNDSAASSGGPLYYGTNSSNVKGYHSISAVTDAMLKTGATANDTSITVKRAAGTGIYYGNVSLREEDQYPSMVFAFDDLGTPTDVARFMCDVAVTRDLYADTLGSFHIRPDLANGINYIFSVDNTGHVTIYGGIEGLAAGVNYDFGVAHGSNNSATDGFLGLPTMDGAPTGVPTIGNRAVVLDTTNNRLYIRSGGAWKYAQLV